MDSHTKRRLVWIFLILAAAFPLASIGQETSNCNEAQVTYQGTPDNLKAKIRVSTSVKNRYVSSSAKKTNSPQGTRWFVEIDPDYMSTAKPWNTTIQIGAASGNKVLVEATFLDHGITFSAQWINEELLFVQVWWGRLASSDLILDVNSGQWIYSRFAHYGQLVSPCEGK